MGITTEINTDHRGKSPDGVNIHPSLEDSKPLLDGIKGVFAIRQLASQILFQRPELSLMGRVVFELFTDLAPKTCEKFRCRMRVAIIHPFHSWFYDPGRRRKMVAGGESIFGGTFDDENLILLIDSDGALLTSGLNPLGAWYQATEVVTKIAEMPTDAKDVLSDPSWYLLAASSKLRRSSPTQSSVSRALQCHKRSVSSDSRSTSSGVI
ncbi:hypothetical protein BS47DRAFT_1436788 [Hydnum rufescens UP504]|uniref:Uncharacterized protein n=1 Tax=Hydnum rufescens UP504 TaxID=1448309 RepID=A0A9P6B600_9AGAM|nr:hypothetical protein BS47DRAFT_1436788 [Hydnum rufescens UP504]